jgi:hypothetical protein
MAHPSLILPKADSSCGRLFYGDRKTADAHRIALEVWNRATGRVRDGYRLAVCRCRRCGGFHIGQRPITPKPVYADPFPDHVADLQVYEAGEESMPW